mgnify:CR=1 FL=1|jgi:hypothetical protein
MENIIEKLKQHKTKIIIALIIIGAVVAYLQQ